MKGRVAFALSAVASSALASVIPQQQVLTNPQIHHAEEKYLIELAPYRTRWVTEEEKWALKLVSLYHFPQDLLALPLWLTDGFMCAIRTA